MADVATLLGITWERQAPRDFTLLPHARKMASSKGFTESEVLAAANHPTVAYESLRYPGQRRHISGRICAVVDPARKVVITAYLNTEKTALRTDQIDADALAFAGCR